MTRTLVLLVLCLVTVYGLIEAWPILRGPTLAITSPQNNSSSTDGVVTVSGRALRAAMLTLDGATLLHEENGDFSTVITLPHGGSILTLAVTDRFGKRITATRTVYVP